MLRMIKGEARVGVAVTAEDLPDNKVMRWRVTRVRDHLEKQLQEWAEQLLPPRAQSSPAFSIAADESPTVTAGRKRPAPTNLAAATAAVAAAPAPKKRRRGKGGKRAAPTNIAVARAARAAAHTTSVPTDADDDDEDMGDVPLRVLGKRSVSPVDHFVAGPTGRRDSLGLGRTNYQRIGRSVDEKQAIEQATHKAQERKALEDAATDRATRITHASRKVQVTAKEKDALPIDIVRAQESALDTTRARLLMHYGPTASRGALKEILTFLHMEGRSEILAARREARSQNPGTKQSYIVRAHKRRASATVATRQVDVMLPQPAIVLHPSRIDVAEMQKVIVCDWARPPAGSYRTINSNLVHTAVIPTINKPKLLLLHILHVGGGSFQARLDDSTLRECLRRGRQPIRGNN